ncbi:MAG: hypothetical protein JWL59_2230 [Chthoniobacteraceae bacterium]|nr:hypothetical protein [Chthoniobacteraceae bacterium]
MKILASNLAVHSRLVVTWLAFSGGYARFAIALRDLFCLSFGESLIRTCGYGFVAWALFAQSARCQDSICVRVKIEIDQDLTLERQGFEARMNVKNGGPVDLENVKVVLNFLDQDKKPVVATSDSNNTGAKFFVRLTSSPALPERVAGGGEEKLRWLIVPAPSSAGSDPTGTLYFVGAKLTYTSSGAESVVDVAPDSIRVEPMPMLALDYFLPFDVYGDDPFTPLIEPSIPFSLGVRIKNSGYGAARKLKIESSQPRIVENKQGLLINFRIEGSEINGQPSTPSLLADFGNIAPNRSAVGRWIMTTSLYGRFVDFSATFTHADELGGQLTSLITDLNAHRLIRDVLVDLSGRDSIRDFLALDGDTLRVYESENYDGSVVDLSSFAGIGPIASGYQITAPASSGFSYIKLADPFGGSKVVNSAMRSDGKPINLANAWLSSTYLPDVQRWNYFLNIFDINNVGGASYAVNFGSPGSGNRAPVLRQPADRVARVGSLIGFIVQASDADGDPVAITVASLPVGASFSDNGHGTAVFEWRPGAEQTGNYPVQFAASDGKLGDRKSTMITVTAGLLYDAWKNRYWPGVTDPAIVGESADGDGDELPNALEYATGSDPTNPDDFAGPEVRVEEYNGLHYLTMTYRQRTDDPGLACTVVAADSLKTPKSNWTPATTVLAVTQENLPEGFIRKKMRDSVAVEGGSGKRFLELRVGRIQ